MRCKLIPAMTALLLNAGLALAEAPGQPLPPAPAGLPAADCAGGSCAAPGGGAVPSDTFRVSAEYLLWTVRGHVPPDVGNVLSGADTNSLPLQTWRSGFRGFISYYPADDFWPGIEVGGFFLENASGQFDTTVATHPGDNPSAVPAALLLQPVIGGSIVVPGSRGIVDSPIPGPGGSVDLDPSDTLTSHLHGTSQRKLWGLEANLRSRSCCFGGLRLDGLVGFRYLNLRERLTVQGDFTFAEPPAGGDADESPTNPEDGHTNVMHTFDSVETRNNFYAGQIGTSFEAWVCNCLVISGFAKVALGGNWEEVQLAGTTTLDPTTIETHAGGPFIPRAGATLPGGLFTPQVPGGTVTHTTHLAVMPELNVKVGYMVTPNVQAYVGYDYLYINNVARLGDQSATAGTSTQGHLQLHGVDFGVQFRY